MEQQLNQTKHRNVKKSASQIQTETAIELYQENSVLLYSILKFFVHSSYLTAALKIVADNIIEDYIFFQYQRYGKSYCLFKLFEFIQTMDIPLKTETELSELSKEELFALVLKDRFKVSNYDIATACTVSVGTILIRLSLARSKAFLGGVSLTTPSQHNCHQFQTNVEESYDLKTKYNISQETCPKCNDFIFKKKQSVEFFSQIPIDSPPENIKEIHYTPVIVKEGAKYRIQISTAPWYYKVLFEGLIASAIMIVLVFTVPAVKKIYEFWLEKRVDIYNLSDFTATTSLSTDPTIGTPKSLLQNAETILQPIQPIAEPTVQSNVPETAIKSENEFIGRESERLSSNKVYRILIKTDSPENIKSSVVSILQSIQFQRTANEDLISELPGGVLFDLFVPFNQYKQLLSSLSSLGEIKVIITRSKEKGIEGKARIKIWLQKI